MIPHVFRFIYGMNKLQISYPVTDTMFVLLTKDDTCMFNSMGVNFYEISIIRTKDIARAYS